MALPVGIWDLARISFAPWGAVIRVEVETFACSLSQQVVVAGSSLIRVVPGSAARAQVPQ